MVRGPENYNRATKFTITDAKAVTSGCLTTCKISEIVMEGPADKSKDGRSVEDDDFWLLDV